MPTQVIYEQHELEELIERRVAKGIEAMLGPMQAALYELRETVQLHKGVLTRNALCQLLDVSVDTIRRYEEKGLRVYRPGRSPLYLQEDVVEFIRGFPDANMKGAA